jgi:hypothetical protein
MSRLRLLMDESYYAITNQTTKKRNDINSQNFDV